MKSIQNYSRFSITKFLPVWFLPLVDPTEFRQYEKIIQYMKVEYHKQLVFSSLEEKKTLIILTMRKLRLISTQYKLKAYSNE